MAMNRNRPLVSSITLVWLLLAPIWLGMFVSVSNDVLGLDHDNENVNSGSDMTWYAQNNPHNISGDIIVNGNLTIEEGAIVKFNNNANIYVYGGLYAMGSETNHIIFTHNSSWDTSTKWGQIKYGIGSYGSLKYCDISRGGKGFNVVQISTTNKVTIENCRINYSTSTGIYVENGNPETT